MKNACFTRRLDRMFRLVIVLVSFFFCLPAFALQASPVIHFSDLISGPGTGIGDGKGSGVIVTIWGQNLGDSQEDSTVTFVDSANQSHSPYIYYWKKADGELPGGPANLHESHVMQEIAISIPDGALGAGQIHVNYGKGKIVSNSLPFTIRSGGDIYHVKSSGSDSDGDGSFDNPWATVEKGDAVAGAGDTLYIHDLDIGGPTVGRAIYNNAGFKATVANQFAYVAYPNTRPTVTGGDGVWMFHSTGIVTSKLMIYSSNCDSKGDNCFQGNSNGIAPSDWGRVVGNAITDQPDGCANSQAGAISGGVGRVEGAKIYGNYVFDYSCPEADKLHHTTYMTIRGAPDDPLIDAWEWGWNYLKDNHAKNGIHNFDQDNSKANACGDMKTDLLIHDNVVVNQAGSGITIESSCGWTQDTYIYNNVLINVGLESDIDCTSNCGVNTSAINVLDELLTGSVFIRGNTIIGWDSEDVPGTANACLVVRGRGNQVNVEFTDNICLATGDKPYLITHVKNNTDFSNRLVVARNNWFYGGENPVYAVLPTKDSAPLVGNPKLIVHRGRAYMGVESDVKSLGGLSSPRGIYGWERSETKVGAFQHVPPPPMPPEPYLE